MFDLLKRSVLLPIPRVRIRSSNHGVVSGSETVEGQRELIVRPAVESPTGLVLPYAAPLFEEKWHALSPTLTAYVDDPFAPHRPCVRATLTAHDYPVDGGQIESAEVGKQRFDREEPNRSGRFLQRPNAGQPVASIFHTHPKGNMRQIAHPSELVRQKSAESFVPLREHLEDVPVGTPHHLANTPDVLGWNVLVEEVAHRVDEYLSRASPMQRLFELLWHESEVEPLFERMPWNTSKAFCECLRVAEFATGTNLGASANGVPSCVGPLDRRAVAHMASLSDSVTGEVTPAGRSLVNDPSDARVLRRPDAFWPILSS